MSIRLLCLLLSLSWVSLVTADIFKSVDKDGKVIYTDKPSGDQPVERVDLPPINTVPPENISEHPPAHTPAKEKISYSIHIVSPRADAIIQPVQRDLGIAVTLDQPLKPDHWLVYFMDGELLEETQATNIIVRNIFRGSHTIVVEVIDKNGVSLGKSDPVVVNVLRPRSKKRRDR